MHLVDAAPHDRVRIEPPGVIPVPLEHGVVDAPRLRLRQDSRDGLDLFALGLPNAALLAIVTRGVLLIRFVFHDPSSVMTSSLSPSGTTQIGVGLGWPSLVNVVNSKYFVMTEVHSSCGGPARVRARLDRARRTKLYQRESPRNMRDNLQ
jgi:hypothetical protein